MKDIPNQSIDMILCDLPYGTTQNNWDSVIPMPDLWKQYQRVIKKNRAMVFTAAQPFTSALVSSNYRLFKWEDIWYKSQATGHLNAKIMPMRQHENILVFGYGKVLYNPQIVDKPAKNIRPVGRRAATDNYGKFNEYAERTIPDDKQYPRSVIKINNTNHGERGLHPTQKPTALFEYLIKTYSNSGDTVLDSCIGSGTTAIACLNTGRNYIGIEKDEKYYNIALTRTAAHE